MPTADNHPLQVFVGYVEREKQKVSSEEEASKHLAAGLACSHGTDGEKEETW